MFSCTLFQAATHIVSMCFSAVFFLNYFFEFFFQFTFFSCGGSSQQHFNLIRCIFFFGHERWQIQQPNRKRRKYLPHPHKKILRRESVDICVLSIRQKAILYIYTFTIFFFLEKDQKRTYICCSKI